MKTTACLIALFLAFGIVGRMDYEDAQAFEAAQQTTQHASNQQ